MEAKKIYCCVINDLSYDQRMQKSCGSLALAGFDITLVGRVLANSIPFSNSLYKTHRLSCLFTKGKLFYTEFNIRLFFYLLFKKTDAILSVDLDTMMACYYAARLKKKKLIHDAHEYFPEVPEVIERSFVKSFWENTEEKYLPKVDFLYTVSASIAAIWEKKYGIKAMIIRNVPSIQTAEPLSAITATLPDEPFILYQGALNKGRGIEQLIEAMRRIDIPLVIAGDGDLTRELKEKTAYWQLQHKVFFLGKITPDELRLITRKAWIGVNLLENIGLNYFYSLANKFFDYIHAELPQICINFPEYEAINNQYSIAEMVDDCEPEKIVQAITRLRRDENLYSFYKQNCIRCKEDLNWEKEAERLTTKIKHLLQ